MTAQRVFNRFVFLLGAVAIAQSPLMLQASKMGRLYHLLITGGGLMMVGSAAHAMRHESTRAYWHGFADGRIQRTWQPWLVPLASVSENTTATAPSDLPVIYNAPNRTEALRVLGVWRQCQVQKRLDEQAQWQTKDNRQLQPSETVPFRQRVKEPHSVKQA